MTLYTIGFTKTTARHFFERLQEAKVETVLDTRLNRDSQLSGFAKAQDLEYFLRELAGIRYAVASTLAPTTGLLKDYRARRLTWDEYERAYRALLDERQPEKTLDLALLRSGCLLCSEDRATRCHRRLAADYLRERLSDSEPVEIVHL